MILDRKKNLDFYRNLGVEGRYAGVVDFLQNTDLEALEPGKHEIDGKNVYVNITTYTTIPWEEAKRETHEHYTSVQYVIEGSEITSYAPIHEITVKVPYNPDKDVVFSESTAPGLRVATGAGQHSVLDPWNAHKPKTTSGEPALAKKVIVKTKED